MHTDRSSIALRSLRFEYLKVFQVMYSEKIGRAHV